MSKKRFRGKVTSDKMQKAVVVSVEVPKKHPIYGKMIKNTQKFKAHNEVNAKLNDEVIIEECVPFSKNVCWKIVDIVSVSKEKK